MQNVLNFLSQLKKNNNREWFNANKDLYEAALEEFKSFVQSVHQEISKSDLIEPAKIFRLYRDMRFSKDKTPFKTNFGALFMRMKPGKGGYYLHIQPDNSFAGGGFWRPEKEELFRIRKEFELNPTDIKKITKGAAFKKHFGEIKGDELKSVPNGFDKEAEAADLIRKKEFILMKNYADKEVAAPDFSKEVITIFKAERPFLDYMSEVLSTDLNGEPVE